MSQIDFPWDEEAIHDLAMRVNKSANRLIEETKMFPDPEEDDGYPTITMEEAIATIGLAVTQVHSTITNSYTAMAMGLMPNEESND